MGHRASYAILENGNLRLFYSHWGALSVPEDVFWGPGYTEAYIESLEEVDFWQDDVFGEGGIGLNKDEHVMTYFGCDTLAYGDIAELYNELVMAWWAEFGWTVRCVEGTPDIAESVGEPRVVAEAVPIDPRPCEPEDLGKYWDEEQRVSSLVSLGPNQHLCADIGVGPFMTTGPVVFDHLDRLPTLDDVITHHAGRPLEDWEEEKGRRGPLANSIWSCVAFDRENKTIDFFAPWTSAHDLEFNRTRVWPGWTITRHDDGLRGHFERLGVDTPPELLDPQWWGDDDEEDEPGFTEADLLNQIHEQLLGPRSDPTVFMSKVIEDATKDGGEDMWVNPHAMVAPTDPRPSDEECEAIFAHAIRALGKSRKMQA